MSTRTGTGTTETIFVIVRVSGDERTEETTRWGRVNGCDERTLRAAVEASATGVRVLAADASGLVPARRTVGRAWCARDAWRATRATVGAATLAGGGGLAATWGAGAGGETGTTVGDSRAVLGAAAATAVPTVLCVSLLPGT
jgi:hypothetical protein